ncbi:hypothetical protein YT1_0613 [Rhodococcus ruber]|nr:hypothetical protein YT1_0613 [Rhodococcus ruber]
MGLALVLCDEFLMAHQPNLGLGRHAEGPFTAPNGTGIGIGS